MFSMVGLALQASDSLLSMMYFSKPIKQCELRVSFTKHSIQRIWEEKGESSRLLLSPCAVSLCLCFFILTLLTLGAGQYNPGSGDAQGDIFYFDYGVVAFWGLEKPQARLQSSSCWSALLVQSIQPCSYICPYNLNIHCVWREQQDLHSKKWLGCKSKFESYLEVYHTFVGRLSSDSGNARAARKSRLVSSIAVNGSIFHSRSKIYCAILWCHARKILCLREKLKLTSSHTTTQPVRNHTFR